MTTSTIFIASSIEGRDIAQSLASKIRERIGGRVQVHGWWSIFDNEKNSLSALSEACRRSDFAVVFLTKDDFVQRNQELHAVPRDNCIFEAGLFMGAFATRGKGGRGETERCHLVTSLTLTHLPTDLHGITVHLFEQNGDMQFLDDIAARLESAIHKLGPAIKPEVECYTQKELLDLERVGKGHLVGGAQVLINLRQPIELRSRFAKRVVTNLQANVRYKYFFLAEEENVALIAELLYSLAGAVRESGESRLVCIQRQIRIYLIRPGRPFEFCVHNSDRERAAVCYLLRPDGSFVEWCSGRKAMDVAQDASSWPSCNEDERWRQRREEEINSVFGDDTVYSRLAQCFGFGQSKSMRDRNLL
jgi:predicted nucleotide-binding protein